MNTSSKTVRQPRVLLANEVDCPTAPCPHSNFVFKTDKGLRSEAAIARVAAPVTRPCIAARSLVGHPPHMLCTTPAILPTNTKYKPWPIPACIRQERFAPQSSSAGGGKERKKTINQSIGLHFVSLSLSLIYTHTKH